MIQELSYKQSIVYYITMIQELSYKQSIVYYITMIQELSYKQSIVYFHILLAKCNAQILIIKSYVYDAWRRLVSWAECPLRVACSELRTFCLSRI